MGTSKTSGSSPCASCKLLRRRCAKDCVFAPYFPADQPQKFASVHKVFGASNVSKMLQELPVHQRGDAVSSMVYESNARVRDPVYGCVGAISYLQQQVANLQMQLARAQAEIMCMHMQQQEALLSDNTDNIIDSKQAIMGFLSDSTDNIDTKQGIMGRMDDHQLHYDQIHANNYHHPSDCSTSSHDSPHQLLTHDQTAYDALDIKEILWT